MDAYGGHYCAGAVAPDARERSEAGCEATRFIRFREPVTWGHATSQLFTRHPDLARTNDVPPAQAAYVAVYLTHLAVDEVFVHFCGVHATSGDRGAVTGLTFAIERYWDKPSEAANGIPKALKLFNPRDITTVVDMERLLRLTPTIASAGSVESPAHLIYLLAKAAGAKISLKEVERGAADRLTTGNALFGDDIADRFAAHAGRETDQRLHAYERGEAASYDSPWLRQGMPDASLSPGENRA